MPVHAVFLVQCNPNLKNQQATQRNGIQLVLQNHQGAHCMGPGVSDIRNDWNVNKVLPILQIILLLMSNKENAESWGLSPKLSPVARNPVGSHFQILSLIKTSGFWHWVRHFTFFVWLHFEAFFQNSKFFLRCFSLALVATQQGHLDKMYFMWSTHWSEITVLRFCYPKVD